MAETRKKNRVKSLLRRFGLKDEIYLFLNNLAILVESGVSIPESLKSIRSEESSKRMRNIIAEVEEQVIQGKSLSSSLKKSGAVSARIYTLLRVGEESGRLTENLKLINLQNDKEVVFRSKIRSSLLYALVVTVVALLVMFITALVILPKLADFYSELDVDLPTITKALISLGTFLAHYGYILLPIVLLVVFIGLYFLFSFPKTRFVGHSLLFKLPLIKRLLKYSEVSSFGFLLGSELQSGIPLLQALTDLPSTTTFKNYKLLYEHVGREIERGASLHDGLSSYPKIKKLFPSQALTVVAAGERSGKLPTSLLRIAEIYERKVDGIAKNLPTIIEPIIIVLIGTFIGIIALATILPIYSLSSAF